ncbi:MAG TPA: hypothetical protein VG456_08745 [Candidatus Sulfopaludibacter sp.]|nr:hypothetical protein [Candidatus Sulfopaludibacter sp.]
MSPEVAARLAGLQIERIAEAKEYLIYARGSCVAMVHGESLGSSGYFTENGIAYLVWRDGQPYLVSKGREVAAEADQVATIEEFSRDLKQALEPGERG